MGPIRRVWSDQVRHALLRSVILARAAVRSSAPFPRDHARAREIADVTTDRVFLRLGPNGALGTDEHQWMCRRPTVN